MILGTIFVLVLAGVFSFIVYKKMGEKFETASESTPAEAPPAAPKAADGTKSAASGDAFASVDQGASGAATAGVATAVEGKETAPAQAGPKPAAIAAKDAETNPFGDAATEPKPAQAAAQDKVDADSGKSLANSEPKPETPGPQPQPLEATTLAEKDGTERPSPAPAGRNPIADGTSVSSSLEPGADGKAAVAEKNLDEKTPSDKVSGNKNPPETNVAQSGPAHKPDSPQPADAKPGEKRQTAQSEPAFTDVLKEPEPAGTVAKVEPPSKQPVAADATVATPTPVPVKTATADDTLKPEAEAIASRGRPRPNAESDLEAGPARPQPQAIPIRSAQASSKTKVQPSESADGDAFDRPSRPRPVDPADELASGQPAASPAPSAVRPGPGAGFAGDSAGDVAAPAGDYYIVQPQDSYWTISRKKYGTSRYFMALTELNKSRIPDPTKMRPGMKVVTPSVEFLDANMGALVAKGSNVQNAAGDDSGGKAGQAGFFVSPDGRPMYRTGEKDTLSEIAVRHLGRSSRWTQLYEMNRAKLSSPNQVKVGTELLLPADASNVAVSNDADDRR